MTQRVWLASPVITGAPRGRPPARPGRARRRRLGQHFLIRRSAIQRVVQAIAPLHVASVRAALTDHLTRAQLLDHVWDGEHPQRNELLVVPHVDVAVRVRRMRDGDLEGGRALLLKLQQSIQAETTKLAAVRGATPAKPHTSIRTPFRERSGFTGDS